MKFWNAIRKNLAVVVVAVSLVALPSCGLIITYVAIFGEDALIDEILDILDFPPSPFARIHIQSLHHSRAGAHPNPNGVVNNPVSQEPAPFFGNFTAITSDPAATSPVFFGLERQSDCSLTRVNFTASVNSQHTSVTLTPLTNTPHYENTIHANAFSTTTPGTWPHGCVASTRGISSRPMVLAGIDAGGNLRVAAVTTGGIATSSVKADGSFLTPVVQATGLQAVAVLTADLNKDGIPDLISINTSGPAGSVTILLGKTDGTYQPGVNLPLPGADTRFGVIDDLDGDGNLDLIVSSDVPSFSYSIFLGKGDGTFKPVQTFVPTGGSPDAERAFITADVNGDHHPDIITARGDVLLNTGDGVTYTLVAHPGFLGLVNGPGPFGPTLLAADFNNDGKLDLATNDAMTIRTYIGNGDGTFSVGHAYATINDLAFMEAADLDGDGNLDIWSGYSGAGVFGPSAIEAAYALLGNGDGTFQGAPSLPTGYAGGNLADLNGDGIPDLAGPVTPPGTSQATFTTFLGQPDGTFKTGSQLNFPNFSTDSFVVGDFNHDGIPDLIFLGSGTPINGYYLAIGDGNGGFGTPTLIPAPALLPPPDLDINLAFSGITAADFNHDGNLDIAYSFMDTSSMTGNITQGFVVQLGNGDGTFKAPVITTTYSSHTAPLVFFSNFIAAVADVNGDHFPDVFLILPTVITDGTLQHQAELFVANGDGSFKAPSNLTLTGNMQAPTNNSLSGVPIGVADLNGDGKVDLVASGSSSDGTTPEIAIALGNGNGTFQPATILQFAGFGYMNSPVVADFDGDGKLDLFLNGAGSIAGIFPGLGDGTFDTFAGTNGQVFPPQGVLLNVWGPAAAADFNRDGKTDVIVGNAVLLNKNGAIPPVLAQTTTALMASPNPAASGATVTLTATVSSQTAGTITGTVTFFDGATSIGTGSVGAAGVAMLQTSTLSAATHSITAQYGGDSNFATSTSSAVSLVINAGAMASTSTALTASPNPAAQGATVTLTATVTSTKAGLISGTVTFFDGANSIGMGTVGAGGAEGVATLQTSSLSVATHSITAMYSGDANYSTSTSQAVSLVINSSTAGFNLGVVPGSVTVTKTRPASATVTVTPVNGFTGQVQFSCLNVPEGIDCEFQPGSVTVNGASATTMLAVGFGSANNNRRRSRPIAAILGGPGHGRTGFSLSGRAAIAPIISLCAFMFLLLSARGRKSRRDFGAGQLHRDLGWAGAVKRAAPVLFAVWALIAIAGLVAGCSGGSGHTSTTTVTIQAVSGNTTANVPLTVTVK